MILPFLCPAPQPAGATPPAGTEILITESGDTLTTEGGDTLITEGT